VTQDESTSNSGSSASILIADALMVWMSCDVGAPVALESIARLPKTALFLVRRENGAGDGDRTRDIELGKLAFYR
jgi:hypothetical protein